MAESKKKTTKVEETETKTKKTTKSKKKVEEKVEESVETKKVDNKKEKKSKVEEKKPLRTEATAKAISLKVTPRKCRLVCDLVRGKDVDEAVELLFYTHKEAASMVAKVIKSAESNAINNFNMNPDKLYVASIMASDSIKMKRYLPRAKGSASGLVKRYTNLYVTVKERD